METKAKDERKKVEVRLSSYVKDELKKSAQASQRSEGVQLNWILDEYFTGGRVIWEHGVKEGIEYYSNMINSSFSFAANDLVRRSLGKLKLIEDFFETENVSV